MDSIIITGMFISMELGSQHNYVFFAHLLLGEYKTYQLEMVLPLLYASPEFTTMPEFILYLIYEERR